MEILLEPIDQVIHEIADSRPELLRRSMFWYPVFCANSGIHRTDEVTKLVLERVRQLKNLRRQERLVVQLCLESYRELEKGTVIVLEPLASLALQKEVLVLIVVEQPLGQLNHLGVLSTIADAKLCLDRIVLESPNLTLQDKSEGADSGHRHVPRGTRSIAAPDQIAALCEDDEEGIVGTLVVWMDISQNLLNLWRSSEYITLIELLLI